MPKKRRNQNKPAVFLGNLRIKSKAKETSEAIIAIFNNIGVTVRRSNISLIHKSHIKFAFVTVRDEATRDYAVRELNKPDVIASEIYSSLAEENQTLKIAKKLDSDTAEGHLSDSDCESSGNNADNEEGLAGSAAANDLDSPVKELHLPARKHVSTIANNTCDSDDEGAQEGHPINVTKSNDATQKFLVKKSLIKIKGTTGQDNSLNCILLSKECVSKDGQETHVRDFRHQHLPPIKASEAAKGKGATNKSQKQRDRVPAVHAGVQSDSVLTHRTGGKQSKANAGRSNFKNYILGAHLGNETRNVEFKAGQGDYKKNIIHKHVGKYVTAFLNSEGGTLLIGINDKGLVEGLALDHKDEDQLRLKIDQAIKEIRPQIFPDMVAVRFVPVTDSIGKIITDLKVVEIQVGKGEATELYQNGKGEAFIRWEGSVQGPLSASSIQEHTRRRLNDDYKRKESEIRNLEKINKQKSNERHALAEELDDEKVKRKELEQERDQLLKERQYWMDKCKKKKTSKVCVVS